MNCDDVLNYKTCNLARKPRSKRQNVKLVRKYFFTVKKLYLQLVQLSDSGGAFIQSIVNKSFVRL